MINGTGEAVGGIVMMLRGENSLEVVKRIEQKVKEINENNVLPQGMKIVPYYDRSEIVEASRNTVIEALIEGSYTSFNHFCICYLEALEVHLCGIDSSTPLTSNYIHNYENSRLER